MSISGVADRISEIQARMASLSQIGASGPSATTAFSTELSAALGANGTSSTSSVSARTVGGSDATGLQQQVLDAARSALGLPYVWGGNSLSTGVDCSGLVQQAYKTIGIDLPRLSADQARSGTAVTSLAEAQPGDLLAWDNSSRNNGADHIAIYLGDGKMIEAPYTGAKVRIVDVPSTPDYIRRVIDSSTVPSARTGSVAGLSQAALNIPTLIGNDSVATSRSAYELQALFAGMS